MFNQITKPRKLVVYWLAVMFFCLAIWETTPFEFEDIYEYVQFEIVDESIYWINSVICGEQCRYQRSIDRIQQRQLELHRLERVKDCRQRANKQTSHGQGPFYVDPTAVCEYIN